VQLLDFVDESRPWKRLMNTLRFWCWSALVIAVLSTVASTPLQAQKRPPRAKKVDFTKQVAPILRKYCAACHNPDEAAGKLLLDTYAGMLKGGKNGAVITPGRSDLSRMIRLITGKDKPQMPPKDNERPTAKELAVLVGWINSGAAGPSGKSLDATVLITPRIKPTGPVKKRVNAIAISKDGAYVAIARYGRVEVEDLS
jgi:uncharacterized membrane protein